MESVSQVEPRTPLSTLGGNADCVVLIAIDNGTIRNWEQYGLNLANGTMIEDGGKQWFRRPGGQLRKHHRQIGINFMNSSGYNLVLNNSCVGITTNYGNLGTGSTTSAGPRTAASAATNPYTNIDIP